MTAVVKITDYRAEEFPLLLEQYKNSAKLKDVIGAVFDQADELETAIFEIRDNYYLFFNNLPSAEGVQLDTIGKIYGESRNSRSDADYRLAIQIRAASRLSGTADDIIFALVGFLGADIAQTTYFPYYPAGFSIQTNIAIPAGLLEVLAPAGVGIGELDFLHYLESDGSLAPLALQDGNFIRISVIA